MLTKLNRTNVLTLVEYIFRAVKKLQVGFKKYDYGMYKHWRKQSSRPTTTWKNIPSKQRNIDGRLRSPLTLILLMWRIGWAHNNARK